MSRKRRPTDAIATAILSFYRSWVIIGLPVALLQNGGLPLPPPIEGGSIARETASPGKYSIETIPISSPVCSRFYSRKKERNDSEAGDFFGEEVRLRKKEGEKKDGEEDWGSGRE